MNNLYVIYKTDILEALDDIQKFTEKIDLFKTKHPEYNYEINIEQVKENKYKIEVLISNEKS